MTTVFDVARYILNKMGGMTAMKLQKLLYYCQAWSMVWDEAPLFSEKVEAWASGPVVRTLFAKHRRKYTLMPSDINGDPLKLTANQKKTTDTVLAYYGDKSADWLSTLGHQETPWLEARQRGGAAPGDQCHEVITPDAMKAYYRDLMERWIASQSQDSPRG